MNFLNHTLPEISESYLDKLARLAVKLAEKHYCFWAQRRRHTLRSGN